MSLLSINSWHSKSLHLKSAQLQPHRILSCQIMAIFAMWRNTTNLSNHFRLRISLCSLFSEHDQNIMCGSSNAFGSQNIEQKKIHFFSIQKQDSLFLLGHIYTNSPNVRLSLINDWPTEKMRPDEFKHFNISYAYWEHFQCTHHYTHQWKWKFSVKIFWLSYYWNHIYWNRFFYILTFFKFVFIYL